MPDMQWQGSRLDTVEGKARALSERFYPETNTDLDDILDIDCQEEYSSTLAISQLVTREEVQAIVQKVRLDKCLGTDEIPNWFLQSIGELLVKAL